MNNKNHKRILYKNEFIRALSSICIHIVLFFILNNVPHDSNIIPYEKKHVYKRQTQQIHIRTAIDIINLIGTDNAKIKEKRGKLSPLIKTKFKSKLKPIINSLKTLPDKKDENDFKKLVNQKNSVDNNLEKIFQGIKNNNQLPFPFLEVKRGVHSITEKSPLVSHLKEKAAIISEMEKIVQKLDKESLIKTGVSKSVFENKIKEISPGENILNLAQKGDKELSKPYKRIIDKKIKYENKENKISNIKMPEMSEVSDKRELSIKKNLPGRQDIRFEHKPKNAIKSIKKIVNDIDIPMKGQGKPEITSEIEKNIEKINIETQFKLGSLKGMTDNKIKDISVTEEPISFAQKGDKNFTKSYKRIIDKNIIYEEKIKNINTNLKTPEIVKTNEKKNVLLQEKNAYKQQVKNELKPKNEVKTINTPSNIINIARNNEDDKKKITRITPELEKKIQKVSNVAVFNKGLREGILEKEFTGRIENISNLEQSQIQLSDKEKDSNKKYSKSGEKKQSLASSFSEKRFSKNKILAENEIMELPVNKIKKYNKILKNINEDTNLKQKNYNNPDLIKTKGKQIKTSSIQTISKIQTQKKKETETINDTLDKELIKKYLMLKEKLKEIDNIKIASNENTHPVLEEGDKEELDKLVNAPIKIEKDSDKLFSQEKITEKTKSVDENIKIKDKKIETDNIDINKIPKIKRMIDRNLVAVSKKATPLTMVSKGGSVIRTAAGSSSAKKTNSNSSPDLDKTRKKETIVSDIKNKKDDLKKITLKENKQKSEEKKEIKEKKLKKFTNDSSLILSKIQEEEKSDRITPPKGRLITTRLTEKNNIDLQMNAEKKSLSIGSDKKLFESGHRMKISDSANKMASKPEKEAYKKISKMPNILIVNHNATHTLGEGEEIEITMEGDPKNVATFDIGSFKTKIIMNEVSSGVYRGTYRVVKGDNAVNANITGYLINNEYLISSLTCNRTVNIDTTPGISIVTPSVATVENAVQTITGVVNDPNIKNVTIAVNKIKYTVPVDKGYFKHDTKLNEGDNIIEVTGNDLYGNTFSDKIEVNFPKNQYVGPKVTITSPADGEIINLLDNPSVEICGTVSDPNITDARITGNHITMDTKVTNGYFSQKIVPVDKINSYVVEVKNSKGELGISEPVTIRTIGLKIYDIVIDLNWDVSDAIVDLALRNPGGKFISRKSRSRIAYDMTKTTRMVLSEKKADFIYKLKTDTFSVKLNLYSNNKLISQEVVFLQQADTGMYTILIKNHKSNKPVKALLGINVTDTKNVSRLNYKQFGPEKLKEDEKWEIFLLCLPRDI